MTEKEIDIKETQGQKKVRQRTDDLLRNKHFMLIIKKLLRADAQIKHSEEGTNKIIKIVDEYKRYYSRYV